MEEFHWTLFLQLRTCSPLLLLDIFLQLKRRVTGSVIDISASWIRIFLRALYAQIKIKYKLMIYCIPNNPGHSCQYCIRIRTAHDCHVISGAHERVHAHNVRDFPQAKLKSKINVRFLSIQHADPYFLLHEFKLHEVSYNIS